MSSKVTKELESTGAGIYSTVIEGFARRIGAALGITDRHLACRRIEVAEENVRKVRSTAARSGSSFGGGCSTEVCLTEERFRNL